jgi:L-asparaginase
VLEEVAFFLSRCYTGETPVVFTGAMRLAGTAGADGPANLRASIAVAAADRLAGRGVLVAFNDRVHDPAGVQKTHTTAVDTFRNPEFGPLGFVEEGRVTWRRRSTGETPALDPDPASLTNEVPAIVATAAMEETLLAASQGAPAVCLAATGAGHLPPQVIPAL